MSETIGQPLQLMKLGNSQAHGQIKVASLNLIQKHSFFEFIRSGLELNLITAIDFTASNLPSWDPKSLHYSPPGGDWLNQYEVCIQSIGSIVCPYDTDQLFPVFGFGAKVGGVISHCFPLTFDPNRPMVSGLEGIIGAYHNAVNQIHFSGPTLFSPIIRSSTQIAVSSPNSYQILLIITDGIINDMQDTIDAIVAAGRVNLSIIIVGVGSANFKDMDILDADDIPLVSRAGKKMERDLVQFVPFEQFKNLHPTVLASQVLEEIPRQVTEWAELNDIHPCTLR